MKLGRQDFNVTDAAKIMLQVCPRRFHWGRNHVELMALGKKKSLRPSGPRARQAQLRLPSPSQLHSVAVASTR